MSCFLVFSCFREFCIAFFAFEIAFIFSNFYELPSGEKKILLSFLIQILRLSVCHCVDTPAPGFLFPLGQNSEACMFSLYPRMYHVRCRYVSLIFLQLRFVVSSSPTDSQPVFCVFFLSSRAFFWDLAKEANSRGVEDVGLGMVSCRYCWVHREDLQFRFSCVSWGASLVA